MLHLSDWRIQCGSASPVRTAPVTETLRWQDPSTPLNIAQIGNTENQVYRLRMSADLAVEVSPDGPILVHSDASVPQVTIDHFLADQVIPRLLAHRGSFVFHAGAVNLDDSALIVMGPSGRGKSTLVAGFNQAGMALIGDDAMVLSMPDGIPHVCPVYPSLRLFPDSLEALMPGAATAGPVAHYSTKQRIDVDVPQDTAEAPLPIRALFAIAPPAGDEPICLRRLSAAEACMTLVESSFALDPTDLDQARRRLVDASALARLVPAFEIAYPRDYARLPEVQRAILDQVAQLQAA